MNYFLIILYICLSLSTAYAEECTHISNNHERLVCYDQQQRQPKSAINEAAMQRVQQAWELTSAYHTPLFSFRAYQPNYLLPLRYTTSTNPKPQSPTHPNTTATSTQPYEVRFQLSFKTQLKRHLFGSPISAWFAYTQQSNWQFYNSQQSAPFRESNYQPEFILNLPTQLSWASIDMPALNFGIVHQSNGQAGAYSRSWNRIYSQALFTHQQWLLQLKLWARLPESRANDDNPDILNYLGNEQLTITYLQEHGSISLSSRYSFSGKRGSMRANWIFPINGHLKAYLELFDGYGETLIDYNHYQHIIAAGFTLSTWH